MPETQDQWRVVDPVRPLGIGDLMAGINPVRSGVWYWCRAHIQSHRSDDQCKCTCGYYDPPIDVRYHQASCPDSKQSDCIRVGPFMSEREANYAGGLRECATCRGWLYILNVHDGGWMDWKHRVEPSDRHEPRAIVAAPLGMEMI